MKVITKESRAKKLGLIKDPPEHRLPSFEKKTTIPDEVWPINLELRYSHANVELPQITQAAIEIAKLVQTIAPEGETVNVTFYFGGRGITVNHTSNSETGVNTAVSFKKPPCTCGA